MNAFLRRTAAITAPGAVLSVATAAQAHAPPSLTHQGRLYDAMDAPINDTVSMKSASLFDGSGR